MTPRRQAGNPKPRLFRLPQDQAVINRMGFNNEGLTPFINCLRARAGKPGIVGANVGANKDSADRIADYVEGLRRVWLQCSFITLNISSPNTPGLRALQGRAALDDLLGPDVLVASTLHGEPLEIRHGAPLRLLSPSQYGYKSVKHLCALEIHVTEPPSTLGPKEHLRARVALEERHSRIPARLLRWPYRLLVPLTITVAERTGRIASEDAQARRQPRAPKAE